MHHPMYVVVISYPIKLIDIFMHAHTHVTLYMYVCTHMHALTCMHTHTYIYRIIYISTCVVFLIKVLRCPGKDPAAIRLHALSHVAVRRKCHHFLVSVGCCFLCCLLSTCSLLVVNCQFALFWTHLLYPC